MEAGTPQPVAMADIPLDDEERKRIARDLGLDESQLDDVPKKLSIARFDDEQVGDDVSGFILSSLRGAVGAPSAPQTGAAGARRRNIPGAFLLPQ